MADQFIGEIRIFGFNFAPTGWAMCNGQLMPIAQNTALFSLLGTQYGGDGKSTYALPNLQGSAPLDQGQGPGLTDRLMGETGGQENVTLISSEMPSHNHTVSCLGSGAGLQGSPQNNVWSGAAGRTPPALYSNAGPNSAMNALDTTPVGSNLPHNNMPPYLVLNFCIALQGIFPARG